MIETIILPFVGRKLALAVYSNGGVPAILQKFTADDEKARNEIKNFKKTVLRQKISKFLNHRQNIMDYHGGLRTEETLKLHTELKRNFDFLYDKSLESNCKFILTVKDRIISLMPGEKSRFYQSTRNTMQEVFDFCEAEISTTNNLKS
jgi:hypothetical protein